MFTFLMTFLTIIFWSPKKKQQREETRPVQKKLSEMNISTAQKKIIYVMHESGRYNVWDNFLFVCVPFAMQKKEETVELEETTICL